MVRTALFRTNRTQAVRLPKALAFPEHVKEVEVRREGNRIIIAPVGGSWDDFFARPGLVDFPEREPQPPADEREPFD